MLTGSRTLFIKGLQRASGLSFTKQNTRLQALVWSEKERVIASPECTIELSKDTRASGRVEETMKGIRKRLQSESETLYGILAAISGIIQMLAKHRERHRSQLDARGTSEWLPRWLMVAVVVASKRIVNKA
jgi:hypothetical protein